MSETKTSELPNISKPNTVVTSPNNKVQKTVRLSALPNTATMNSKLAGANKED